MSRFKIVWETWQKWNKEISMPMWYGYTAMQDETDISLKDLKKFFKLIRNYRVGYYMHTVTDNGKVAGSGYFISEKYENYIWENIKEILDKGVKE